MFIKHCFKNSPALLYHQANSEMDEQRLKIACQHAANHIPQQNIPVWSTQLCLFVILIWLMIPQLVFATKIAESETESISVNKVIVSVLTNFPPHYQIDDTGQPHGFAVDVMEHVAQLADIEISYQSVPLWSDALAALEQGEVDIIPNLGITPARKVKYAFTRPVETFPIGLFVRDASEGVTNIDDLEGKRVAVVEKNVGVRIIKAYPAVETHIFNDNERALFALLAGEVDGFIYPIPVTWQLAQRFRIDHQIRLVGEPMLEVKRAMAVRRDNRKLLERLDHAVAIFLASEDYPLIYERWFARPKPYWNTQRILTIGGPIAVALLLVTIFGMTYWRYRSTLTLNTELRQSIEQRDMAQHKLRELNEDLESRVNERTAALLQEIAERKLIQEELGRFKLTLDQTMDCVFMFEPATLNYIYVNRGAIEQVGYSIKELLTMTPLDIKPEFDEQSFRAICIPLIHGPQHSSIFETIHRHKDGHDIPVEIFLQYIDPDDTPPRFVAIVRDTTERQHAEEEKGRLQYYLNEVLNAMPSIVVGINADGLITHWNREAAVLTGIDLEQAAGHPVSELLDMLSNHMEEIISAVKSGQRLTLPRISYLHKGEHRHADIIVYPLAAKDNQEAVIRLDDVTERTHMEEMMVQTEKMLSVGGLAGGMAHELNNPLGGIVQGIQNIRRRFSTELEKNVSAASHAGIELERLQQYLAERDIDKMMANIANAGERAGKIINNMLRFSRSSEITFQLIRIEELLEQTVELAAVDYDLKKKYDFRSITIKSDYQPELPPLSCIPGEIQQVVLNILRNAAQAFMEQSERTESPCITLRTRQEGDQFQLEVEDNGPGMNDVVCRRAFEPFFTTKEPGEGTGLGLSVSYYIIHDEHGGDIKVESSHDKGSKFTISLPYSR